MTRVEEPRDLSCTDRFWEFGVMDLLMPDLSRADLSWMSELSLLLSYLLALADGVGVYSESDSRRRAM